MVFQIEYDFTLPRGFVDSHGNIHREGVMRMASAADEIYPLRSPKVKENPEYLIIEILSRVIVSLGSLQNIDTAVIEKLFVPDMEYLQNLYSRINSMEEPFYEGVCPNCNRMVKIPVNFQQAGR